MVKIEPKPLSEEVPTEIQKIISKCLRKNRDERYQTIKDVGNDLKDVKQDLEFQDKLERSIVPNQDENKTQILKATTIDEIHQTGFGQRIDCNNFRAVLFGFFEGIEHSRRIRARILPNDDD